MESHYFDKDYFIFAIIFNRYKVATEKPGLTCTNRPRQAESNLFETVSISATLPIIYIFFLLTNPYCRWRQPHGNPRAARR